jgi:hypothetical protein
MIDRFIDEHTGIIHVTGQGIWTREAVDQHYAMLRQLILSVRYMGRPVRVLSNVTSAARQSPEIEARILEQMARSYLAGDRVALLAANSVAKLHIRSVIGNAEIGLFCSPLAAETWLLAHEQQAKVA